MCDVTQGRISKGDKIRFMNTGKAADITEVGVLSPKESPVDYLEAGEVGYMMAGIKSVEDARVGDTITLESESRRAEEPLPGYAEAKPMVWCGMFPTDAADYDSLRDSLARSATRVMDLFRKWDDDQSGTVSKKEFRKAIVELGFDCPREALDALYRGDERAWNSGLRGEEATISGLTPGTAYRFSVSVASASGELGPRSEPLVTSTSAACLPSSHPECRFPSAEAIAPPLVHALDCNALVVELPKLPTSPCDASRLAVGPARQTPAVGNQSIGASYTYGPYMAPGRPVRVLAARRRAHRRLRGCIR